MVRVVMILLGNLHAGGHSDRGTHSPSTLVPMDYSK